MKIKLDGTLSSDGVIQPEEAIQYNSERQGIKQDALNAWQILFALLIPVVVVFLFGYLKGGVYRGFQFLKFFEISMFWCISGTFIVCFLSYGVYRIFEEKPKAKDFLISAGGLVGLALFVIVIKQLLPACYSFLNTVSKLF